MARKTETKHPPSTEELLARSQRERLPAPGVPGGGGGGGEVGGGISGEQITPATVRRAGAGVLGGAATGGTGRAEEFTAQARRQVLAGSRRAQQGTRGEG